ncbi:MAG: serine/threonine protein kinase [Lachnospiraceae bacterium]|nr:serine/threonine protein kinase [Lachnospiraceae bacterium]
MTAEGTILDGKYEIWKEVGRGGMSIVYLARDKRLNKQWAVKEIKNDGSKSTETLLKGLEREANILKNVDHPVLPRIVDIIDQNGVIYVVMDFIEGVTISDRLKEEGAQPQELVIEWGLQLASALDYLHNMKPPVIYRDMKPSNVMIKPEGGVKLIDFGTAKEYVIENNADTTALGTRGYAAPEQFGDSKGHGIYNTDARTDIYNLGATLYHVVTGMNPCEPPYEIKPIREWNPKLSSGLEKILLKCTQPNPDDRYQSCKELMYALEHYRELDDEYRKKDKKSLALFTGAVVLSLICGGVALYGRKGILRERLNNYNNYVETGDSARYVDNDLKAAADYYKKAFELEPDETEAYLKYIQTYIDSENELSEGASKQLDINQGLGIIANRIKSGSGGVDKNNAVLYKLALTYFDELGDYKTAIKYLSMVDKTDEEYGKLADYYNSVATILSTTNVDAGGLIDSVNSFADYNSKNYTNQNAEKFFNYKIIGRIYATYITEDGVAEKAEQVMAKAVEDLDEYTGNEINPNEYYYAFYDNLVTIYGELGRQSADEISKQSNYALAIGYAQEFINILDIVAYGNEEVGIGLDYDNALNTAYYNKMAFIANCYKQVGEFDNVYATYTEAEKKLGKNNVMSNKIFADHLDTVFTQCELKEQDPTKWAKNIKSDTEYLISVYDDGLDVKDIESNKTWKKRKETVELVKESMGK